ncbi:UDP-glucose dehydrogenase family protein [Variovorax sp. PAMC 28711]|uniref:UDP-glucose dehydrogenase family protein n=1 Tax=Variovorax sp. PAMC 28711 TaxID=1795631 RepID=UPI00078BB124|nr:UDP-glucose/GDP-mannose dehydrogenase family protein [Variovorax sp. PAMC 28711]AMM24233.1 UDP-glucose 6-dehydrogenase [Variovorax sp. PAMC 28711]
MRICVVGSGYVGLVSGACLAALGHGVTCVDRDVQRIADLEQGKIPFFEPGLQALVAEGRVVRPDGRTPLRFSSNLEEGVAQAELVIIAVGTPMAQDGENADLSQLHASVEASAKAMQPDAVLVIKSTAPIGTGDDIQRRVQEVRPSAHIAVVSNPEFLREGSAIDDFIEPARVVIGSESDKASALVRRLYAPLTAKGIPVVVTSRRTAELIKYAANSFLATKLAFINEIADFCEQVGSDVEEVAVGMGLDPRIGSQYLRAGPGYGGSCLPKDLVALRGTAQAHHAPLRIVETVIALNEQRTEAMVEKIRRAFDGNVDGKTIAILGVAFKPDTDDVRAAPALALAIALCAANATVRLSDPQALHHVLALVPQATCLDDPYECSKGCDAIVIATEWSQYRALDLPRLRRGMRTPVLIDLRNIFCPQAAVAAGFAYTGLGKGNLQGSKRGPVSSEQGVRP